MCASPFSTGHSLAHLDGSIQISKQTMKIAHCAFLRDKPHDFACSPVQVVAGTGGTAFLDIDGTSYMVGALSYKVVWVNGSNGYSGSPSPYIPGYGEASEGELGPNRRLLAPAVGALGPLPGSGSLSDAFLGIGVARNLWSRRAVGARRRQGAN
jgi:hypothetical protein